MGYVNENHVIEPPVGALLDFADIGDKDTVMYDKFIIVELEKYMTPEQAIAAWQADGGQVDAVEEGGKLVNKIVLAAGSTDNERNNAIYELTEKIRIGTKEFSTYFADGVKPLVSVTAEFLPSYRVSGVTVSITNMEFEVDITEFFFMTVEFGYLNGKSRKIRGPIMNSYIESPNPNGKTVFQMFESGYASQLLQPQRIILEFNGKAKWLESLEAAVKKCEINFFNELPKTPNEFNDYADIPIMNLKATKTFKNVQEVVNYYNKIGTDIFRSYGLVPPVIYDDTYGVHVTTPGAVLDAPDMPKLNVIKTASYTGGAISIKLPYNPEVDVFKPFYCDPKFFRGRFNAQSIINGLSDNKIIQNLKNAASKAPGVAANGQYQCIGFKLNFDTGNTNDMVITGVALDDAAFSQTVANAQFKADSLDGWGALNLPPWIAPSNAAPVDKLKKDKTETEPTGNEQAEMKMKCYIWQEGEQGYNVFGKGKWDILCDDKYDYQKNNSDAASVAQMYINKDDYGPTKKTRMMKAGMTVCYPAEWDDIEGGSPANYGWGYDVEGWKRNSKGIMVKSL
jgi:hypothetical protein